MKISNEKKMVLENPHKSYISSMCYNPKNKNILATSCNFFKKWLTHSSINHNLIIILNFYFINWDANYKKAINLKKKLKSKGSLRKTMEYWFQWETRIKFEGNIIL